MPVSILTLEKVIRRTHNKQTIPEQNLSNFKTNLLKLLDKLKDHNREGKQETDLRDFLNDSFYKNRFYINKKETADWVIFNDEHGKGKVSVIIEMKSTSAKVEMLTEVEPNVKALHELVLYYLRERIDNNNHEIKHLIATNGLEWYVFNELWFHEHFFTAAFKKSYQDWKLSGHSTDDFYKLFAKPHIANLDIEFCKLDLRDYPKASNKKLSELYKILSPEHLLKLEIANDANKLNRPFYNELLYILGIEERKAADSNKKIIDRILPEKRQDGSLIENVINKLNVKDCLRNVKNLESFGESREDQLYSVALELCITWLNRILFLKLLESQLVKYHNDDKSFKFLSYDKIHDFDELSELFFEVLAIPTLQRTESVNKKFGQIPYLNSSLFELSELEKETVSIEDLKDRLEISYFGNSVLVNDNGKPQKGEINTLKYLLGFLDAYRFGASDDEESIKQDKLINAAVLGLIFEKLNGYKDGSFYTPAFITMYMCRETIRRAVVQKFNETNNWGCEAFEDLHEHIEYKNPKEREAYNVLINSIKICDPAVGSGHFLVSALNEMIAVKSELKILQHPNGTRIKDIEISIDNDELTVYDQNEGQDFNYMVGKGGGLISEKQLLQETLFEEKRTIIENCLFGVDINPKSVKICQLRLWIELLKNAYYKPDGELETLPNIDINIKSGNSLVSKYALDEDLSEVFKKQEFTRQTYLDAVEAYKEAKSKQTKEGLKDFIGKIKEQFKATVSLHDQKRKDRKKAKEELLLLDYNSDMFGNQKLNEKELQAKKKKYNDIISNLTAEINDIEDNKIYRNSFEWRFEFPEVLNDKGDFVGFDVVIGNPPYLRVRNNENSVREYFSKSYGVAENQFDLFHLFIERGKGISKINKGILSFIVPNTFLGNENCKLLRKYILDNFQINIIVDIKSKVFEDASVEVSILDFENKQQDGISKYLELGTDGEYIFKHYFKQNEYLENKNFNFSVTLNTSANQIIARIGGKSQNLDTIFDVISGIKEYQIGKGRPLQSQFEVENRVFNSREKLNDNYLPEIRGKNVRSYDLEWTGEYIKYGEWLAEPRNRHFFVGEKILIRQIPAKTKLVVGFTQDDYVVDQTAYIGKLKQDFVKIWDYKTILALLNSKLIFWYFQNSNNEFDGIFPKIKINEFKKLPLYKFENLVSQKPFMEKVDEILALKKADPSADTSTFEAEIDRMVYDLYELTEEEIAIVEGK